jgi:hypothetical protein
MLLISLYRCRGPGWQGQPWHLYVDRYPLFLISSQTHQFQSIGSMHSLHKPHPILCHIYYPETAEQKEHYEEQIDTLNEGEVEAECRLAFDKQERWTRQGKNFPTRCASWEIYWKNHKQKRDKRSRGGVDNI